MKTIIYKTGLILIILAWVMYLLSYPVVLTVALFLRIAGVKFLHRYSMYVNRLITIWNINLKNWYVRKTWEDLP